MSPSCCASAARTARAMASGRSRGAGDVARGVLDRDREHPAGAFDDLGVHQAGEARAIGGGGHRQQPQLRPQHALQVEAQRERQVGFQRALVDLVEDHAATPSSPGSDCRRRSSRPSVMTSMRVVG